MSGPTREQVIKWAHESITLCGALGMLKTTDDDLARFAELAYAAGQDAEREAMKPAIVAACKAHTREMEGYSYFGSNPGVHEDDYEDVANDAAAIRARGQK